MHMTIVHWFNIFYFVAHQKGLDSAKMDAIS